MNQFLYLLDDNIIQQWPDNHAWQELQNQVNKSYALAAPSSKVAKAVLNAKKAIQKNPLISAPKKKITQNVFSSTPSLKEMMSQYNGRTSRLPPIKTPKQPTLEQPDFRSARLELIEVPGVDGKILRPK